MKLLSLTTLLSLLNCSGLQKIFFSLSELVPMYSAMELSDCVRWDQGEPTLAPCRASPLLRSFELAMHTPAFGTRAKAAIRLFIRKGVHRVEGVRGSLLSFFIISLHLRGHVSPGLTCVLITPLPLLCSITQQQTQLCPGQCSHSLAAMSQWPHPSWENSPQFMGATLKTTAKLHPLCRGGLQPMKKAG